jgi:hypothetical protein
MNTKNRWRNALGLGQIMATLLVVLPAIAFSVTFLLDYWRIMQIDYKLKLIANMSAEYFNSLKNTKDFVNETNFKKRIESLCPGGITPIIEDISYNGNAGEIFLTVKHTTSANSTYLKSKVLTTDIHTYSYHDQNLTATIKCP